MSRMGSVVGVVVSLALAAQAQDATPRRVTFGEARTDSAKVITPVLIDDAAGLLAGDIDLLLDAAAMAPVDVRPGDLLKGFFLLDNVVADTLKVSFASAEAIVGGSGVLFDVVTPGTAVPRFAFLLVSLNGDQMPVTTAVVETDAAQATPPHSLVAFPNPFNAHTTLAFANARPEAVRLEIYNVNQQVIRVLAAGPYGQGIHAIPWDGTDGQGRAVASGRYVAHLRASERRVSVPLLLLR